METFLASVSEYGYWILIIGALIEGESILLLAGAAAYMGYFSLPLVISVSFVGAIIHDQLLYGLGKIGGITFLRRSTLFKEKADRAFRLLKKHEYWLIMGFRFVYGLRTITPVVLGASDISFKRYSFLTITSAALWAVIISGVGYGLANVIDAMIDSFEVYKYYIMGGPPLFIGLGIGIFYMVRSRKFKKMKSLQYPLSSSERQGEQ